MTYDSLIMDPDYEIKKLFKYINAKPFTLDLSKIYQFSLNDITYDDSQFIENIHLIRTNSIEKNRYDVKKYLNEKLIKLCNEYEPHLR